MARQFECQCGEILPVEKKSRRDTVEIVDLSPTERLLVSPVGCGVHVRRTGPRLNKWEEVAKLLPAQVKEARAKQEALATRPFDYKKSLRERAEAATWKKFERLDQEARQAIATHTKAGLEFGRLLAEAENILTPHEMHAWLKDLGFNPWQRTHYVGAWNVSRAHSTFLQRSKNSILAAYHFSRLPGPLQKEIMAHGLPLNGSRIPIEEANARQWAALVKTHGDRDPRGRKAAPPPPRPEPEPPVEWGPAGPEPWEGCDSFTPKPISLAVHAANEAITTIEEYLDREVTGEELSGLYMAQTILENRIRHIGEALNEARERLGYAEWIDVPIPEPERSPDPEKTAAMRAEIKEHMRYVEAHGLRAAHRRMRELARAQAQQQAE